MGGFDLTPILPTAQRCVHLCVLPSIVTIGKNCYCIPQKHPHPAPPPLKFFHLLNTFPAYFPIPSNNSVISKKLVSLGTI